MFMCVFESLCAHEHVHVCVAITSSIDHLGTIWFYSVCVCVCVVCVCMTLCVH